MFTPRSHAYGTLKSTRLGLPRQAAAALAHQLVGVALKHAPDGVLVHDRVHGEQAHEPAVVAKGASCCGFEDGSKVHSRRHGHMRLHSARSSSSWPRGSPAQGYLSHPPSSSSPPTVYLYRTRFADKSRGLRAGIIDGPRPGSGYIEP
ncbi:hypothetical protein H9P43_004872 [Blastocladiella emersonii ATCC 22665]|nr:hypothetical protein H9P43_004872 [Blastocladiella emersonii ATCC 22665]